jgi:hypothetical protein
VDRGPETLQLDLPLFDDYFYCLQFKTEEGSESELLEPLHDGHQSLYIAFINAFAKTINLSTALKNIKQVAVLARPVSQINQLEAILTIKLFFLLP